METSSDSDTTDEWIVLDNDVDDTEFLIKDQATLEDDVSGCVDCPDACGVSEERTTSLDFTEEGNPPDNGEVPPAEDLEVHDHHVENFVEPAQDLSSYTKDELPENIDMTPAVRHYVHKKNVNLNSLLNIYLALAVIAASALGLGNFLGWSYCSNLKSELHKQEQMLEQLQNKLSDCNSHLNVSNLLSSDSGHSRYSGPAEEIEHQRKNSEHTAFQEEKSQKKTGEHWALLDSKHLRNLIHYPLSALEPRSDSPSFVRSADKHEQAGVLRHVFYFQNVKPDIVNIKSGTEQLGESQERKGSIMEFIAHKPVHTPIPNLGFGKAPVIGLNAEAYKETFSTANPLSNQWKESPLNLKFPDLHIGKHFSDIGTVLDMSHFNIAFPQKKGLESQENFNSNSYLEPDRVNNLESLKIPNFDIRNNQLNLEDSEVKYNPTPQDMESNYHTASLISSMNFIMSLQQMQHIREDYFKSNLNVTQAVFQELLENLREKLEDIKNFTLSPLFIKHPHYSQKTVKKLLKVFDVFMGRLLKYSDKFLQKNIHRDNKMDKLTGKMLSCMNKLNCKWQKIKDKWQHFIQYEQSSENSHYKGSRCHSGDCRKKKFGSHTHKCEQDKPDFSECLIKREKDRVKGKSNDRVVMEHQKTMECLRNVYFGEKAKQQVKEKSDYQIAVEQLIKEEFFGERTKDKSKLSYLDVMENKFSGGRIKELLKDKRILQFLSSMHFDEIPEEQMKGESDYHTVLNHLRNMYIGKQEKEQMKGRFNYQRNLELLRSMYFGNIAMEQGIDTTNYFRTVECFVKGKFSGGKENEPVKDKSDFRKSIKNQKIVEHFGNVDSRERAKQLVRSKLDGKKPADYIAKDEFYDVRAEVKREDMSAYWETVENDMKGEFSSRKAKEWGKDKSDIPRTVEHLINIQFAGKAKKQVKDTSGYKKHLEYHVKDKFFGGKAKEKMKSKSLYKDKEWNYENKDVFEEKLKNGKGKGYSQNYKKMNKKEKHFNSDIKKSKIFKYKEDNRRYFVNNQKVPGKRNKPDNGGES